MIIDKLNSILNSTEEESLRHQIAQTIKYNINIMATLSIGELADDCQFYHHYSKNVPLLEYDKTIQESCYSYIEEVYDVMLQFMNSLDFHEFQMFIIQIYHGLYLFGNEKDNLVCQKFQKDLDYFGKSTTILDYDLSDEYQINPSSLFVVFYTCDDCYMNSQIIKKILRHHQPVWLITTKQIDYPTVKTLKLPSSQLTIDNNILYMFIDMMISSYSQYKRKVHKS